MLQRLLLLKDVASGLQVLHASNVVHGDLVRVKVTNPVCCKLSAWRPGGWWHGVAVGCCCAVLHNNAVNSCSVVHGDLVRDSTVLLSIAAVQCSAVERLTAVAYDLACKLCGVTGAARGLGAWQESAACAVQWGVEKQ
jgi:hypothetical protein